jgi:protein TonB
MHPSDQVETHSSDASQAGIEAATLEQETVSPQEDASVKVGSGPLPAAPRGTPELAVHKARPLYLQNPSPPYPRLARRRGYEGSVVLDVLVLSDGTVGDLRVATSSGHKILDRAAVAAVRSWLFEAGKKGDQKVDTWVRVPIRFELDR